MELSLHGTEQREDFSDQGRHCQLPESLLQLVHFLPHLRSLQGILSLTLSKHPRVSCVDFRHSLLEMFSLFRKALVSADARPIGIASDLLLLG